MNRVVTCFAVILVGAVSSSFADEHRPAKAQIDPAAQIALDQNSIAILPFEVLTDDPIGPDLARDAYNELLKQLATVEELNVVQQDRVESFGDTEMSAAEIGRELGAGNIIRGEIQLWPPYYVLHLKFTNPQDSRSRSGTSSLIGVTDPTIKCAINPETALPDGIAEAVTSVERWIYPVAEPTREEMAVISRAMFLDSSLSDMERLQTMKHFAPPRSRNTFPAEYFGSSEIMTGSVAVAAAQIGLESDDESVRHGMWSRMAGVGDLYLVEPLMKSLRNDDDVWVRAQAAMTLVDFLDEPGVRGTLDYARVNDSERMVRKAANFSLLTPSERLVNLRELVLDRTESDWDRTSALRDLRRRPNATEPYDEELLTIALALAQRSRDHRVRKSVWFKLGETNGPQVVAQLIAALAQDSSERVRESVLMSLGYRLIDEPGVREAIEHSKANDASPLVRKRAEDILARNSAEFVAVQR